MPGLAELTAVIVCGGTALAAVNRDRLLAILGIAVALLAAPLVGPRAPDLLSLAFREVAVLTGTYLLWISTSRGTETGTVEGHGNAPVFPAVVVILAFVGVLVLGPMLGQQRGPTVALAAAASAGIAALALGATGTDLLAGGLSAIMLVLAASLAVTGLAGVNGPLEHGVIGAALLAVSTAAAFLGSGQPAVPSGAATLSSGAIGPPPTEGPDQAAEAEAPAAAAPAAETSAPEAAAPETAAPTVPAPETPAASPPPPDAPGLPDLPGE